MRAVIWEKYGPPSGLVLGEMHRPSPADNEILVRVHAVTASTPDAEIRRMKLALGFALPIRLYSGLFRPARIKVLGTEFSGEVAAVGKDVTRFTPAEQVFGYAGLRMGAYAEYVCLPDKSSGLTGVLGPKPANTSFEEAAALVFGGLEAMHALGRAQLQPRQKVLIVGAGGSIGTSAVQLASRAGAEVTGVDKPGKLDLVRSLGAAHVIDYTRQDFTRLGNKYDVILDTIDKSPFAASLEILTAEGVYLNAKPGLPGKRLMRSPEHSRKRILPWSSPYSTRNLLALKELVEAGALKAVIDRRYLLEQVVEAHRYVDSGEKRGNVVMTVIPHSS
jgi:NADPH:quinone reductase-like Zn-dependent oxidoreductase